MGFYIKAHIGNANYFSLRRYVVLLYVLYCFRGQALYQKIMVITLVTPLPLVTALHRLAVLGILVFTNAPCSASFLIRLYSDTYYYVSHVSLV